ncbi:TIGR03087 family PEP-CTERM/XrtA system glycosyltransferase [uncultured Desulfobacter sp.]|uniref:TIGR03087 family PEP-CTERM/XrtA system glycosyltransferase n=1 Tax=uncultured Desulfobacter sp. TaxID=240139 RepID=UPI002AAB8C59|nr:TIGR03087 family PEP-CTERM/XrtA system glycosyltransferase [uncultured Desulfobacter sp.]
MKILYLAHRVPYPPNKGDKIRTFNEIKWLSQNHIIDLLALADDPNDLLHKKKLKNYCNRVEVFGLNIWKSKINSLTGLIIPSRPLSVSYFYNKKLQAILDQWITVTNYDAIICFSSPMAEYLFRCPVLKKTLNPRKPLSKWSLPVLIMDFCDVDSQKWHQYAANSHFPINLIYGIESRRLFQYEKIINRTFHHSVFVSTHEVDVFTKLNKLARNLTTVSNGVDHDYFSPDARFEPVPLRKKKDQKILVFTGAMDYFANVEGVSWFCREVFPRIRKKIPGVLFYIVGSNPAPDVKALGNRQGVRVTGFVDDIRPYYQGADVCVIPLRIAAGIQNKVLEAMSMARPLVTTGKALEGIKAKPDVHILKEDDPKFFADKVIQLLNSREKRTILADNARIFIIKNYNWQTNIAALERLLPLKPAAN